ncbi:hypothetical protein D3C87_2050490 [compost metagenome]
MEVRCRREDLLITNLELKTPKRRKSLFGKPDTAAEENNVLAAHAVIRTRLFEEGLFRGESDDRYAVMTLASIQAESE